jgi:hypothetical protein
VRLAVLGQFGGVLRRKVRDAGVGLHIEALGQTSHKILERLANGDLASGLASLFFLDLLQVAMDRGLSSQCIAELLPDRIDRRIAPHRQQIFAL